MREKTMSRGGFKGPRYQGGWAAIPWIMGALAIGGTMMGSKGSHEAGVAEARRGGRLKALGSFEAAQLEQNALTEVAASQRVGMEEERRAELAQSRALALAAASGGGASDPTVTKIISDLAGEGSYRKSVALYEGEERARQMRLGAWARRKEGEAGLQGGLASQRAFQTAGTARAMTSVAQIGTNIYANRDTLFTKYGRGGPPPVDDINQDAGLPGFQPYA